MREHTESSGSESSDTEVVQKVMQKVASSGVQIFDEKKEAEPGERYSKAIE
jgi:hypothetical protein